MQKTPKQSDQWLPRYEANNNSGSQWCQVAKSIQTHCAVQHCFSCISPIYHPFSLLSFGITIIFQSHFDGMLIKCSHAPCLSVTMVLAAIWTVLVLFRAFMHTDNPCKGSHVCDIHYFHLKFGKPLILDWLNTQLMPKYSLHMMNGMLLMHYCQSWCVNCM